MNNLGATARLPRVLLIENPFSRMSRSAVDSAVTLLTNQGWNIERRSPENLPDLHHLARQCRDYDTVAIAGGDGTLSQFAQDLPDDAPPILLLPRGTANVVARDLGLPLSPIRIARYSARLRPRRIKVGEIAYADGARRRFVLSVGAGIIAGAVHKVSPALKRLSGGASYAASLICALVSPAPRVTVDIRGEKLEGVALIATLTRHYAGGFLMSPRSGADDGLMDLHIAQSAGHFSRFLVDAAVGRAEHSRAAIHRRAAEFTIASEGLLESDGDPAGSGPCEVRVLRSIDALGFPANGSQ